jgi:hypothetical protein
VNQPAAKSAPAVRGQNLSTVQPCSDFCAGFRSLDPYRWPDFGRCVHPHSPQRGFPVRIGRDCASYRVQGATEFTRAS